MNRQDPSVSKTINVCETRTGEKLDLEEMRKREAKEVQELDESNNTWIEGMVKIGGNTKESKQALVRVVWSQPPRRQYSVEIMDQVYQEMWMVERLL